jgi:membrane associated rhomboid family serine protease
MEELMKYANYFEYNSTVTLSFFFISLVVLILDVLFAKIPRKVLFSTGHTSLLNPITYVRFFTHIFGHADWSHFSNNFMKILIVGPLIEEKYGSILLVIMIGITALITAVINRFLNKDTVVYGASGIAFMLIVLSAFSNFTGKIPVTLVLIILFYVIDEIVHLFKDDGVSHLSHIVGAICGGVFGFLSLNQPLMDTVLNLFKA